MRNHLVAAVLLAAACPPIASPAELPSSSDAVAVEINGVQITLKEIESKRPAAIFQARSNYYESARRSIDEFVDDYLLQAQARKENASVAELLEKHVTSKIAKDPSEETLRVYYETAETTEPYEIVRQKIVDAIRQKRISKAKAAYMQELRAGARITVRLPAPRAPIGAGEAPARGPASAKVVLTEFADYECPYCQQMMPAIAKLEAEFAGKIAYRYKDYPLPMHPNAQKAAEATRCALAQGKYWEFHDLLAASKQLDVSYLKAAARHLKLDGAVFDKCLDNGETALAVQADAAEAQALGLQGTPTFFINGRYVSGNLSYERLRAVILEELAQEAKPAPKSQAAARRE